MMIFAYNKDGIIATGRVPNGMHGVCGTNMGPVFLFVFDRLNIDHYLTSSSSVDGKFHALHRYVIEISKKLIINYILRF